MTRKDWMHYIGIILLGAALSVAWGVLSGLLHLDRIYSNQVQEQMFSEALPLQIAVYGFFSPVMEEILFRWLLYGLFRRRLPEKMSAVLCAALFALWHGNMIQILYAFPMGLLFQFLYRRDRTLLSPVCCHIGANMTAILVEALIH